MVNSLSFSSRVSHQIVERNRRIFRHNAPGELEIHDDDDGNEKIIKKQQLY